jgi:hypothetical protein
MELHVIDVRPPISQSDFGACVIEPEVVMTEDADNVRQIDGEVEQRRKNEERNQDVSRVRKRTKPIAIKPRRPSPPARLCFSRCGRAAM